MNQPHVPPPKKRRTGLIVLLAVCGAMAIMFVGCVAIIASSGGGATVAGSGERTSGGGSDDGGDTAGSDDEATQAARVDDTVTSGDLQLTVTNVETATEVSDDSGFLTEEARGKYVIVDVEITNNGDDALNFFAAAVPLVDQDGNQHDSTADVAVVRGDSDLAEPVNPGSTAQGFIAYDVPEDTKVQQSHIEVSGGFLDEPVRVRLR